MKKITTQRGFEVVEFTDTYGEQCSLQESSVVPHIWIGINKVSPKILARDAAAMGREDLLQAGPERYNGWVDWPLPDTVKLFPRMHLSQEQVKELLPLLEHFAKTGRLP